MDMNLGSQPTSRRTFAEGTSVSVEKSRAEIERTLINHGADQFASGWNTSSAQIGFRCRGRYVRFTLSLPDRDDPSFSRTPARRYLRTPEEQLKAWEQACRERWRALALVIKAKLEAVECGISSFEEEFLAAILLPDGETVGSRAIPAITEAYTTGRMPPLLPPPKESS